MPLNHKNHLKVKLMTFYLDVLEYLMLIPFLRKLLVDHYKQTCLTTLSILMSIKITNEIDDMIINEVRKQAEISYEE